MLSYSDALKKKAAEEGPAPVKKAVLLKKKASVKKTKTKQTDEFTVVSRPKKRKASMMEVDPPAEEAGASESNTSQVAEPPVFRPAKKIKQVLAESRKIAVPKHRLTPLRNNWMKIYTPIVENLLLNIRFTPKNKLIEVRTTDKTPNTANIQKAADFIQAFVYGFEVDDALALIRLHDLFIETFDIKDVKLSLAGDHIGRAIGRIAGKGGKTRFVLENTTKTRIVIADSRIHILGSFNDVAQARRAICSLILGSPPAKVFGNLQSYASTRKDCGL